MKPTSAGSSTTMAKLSKLVDEAEADKSSDLGGKLREVSGTSLLCFCVSYCSLLLLLTG